VLKALISARIFVLEGTPVGFFLVRLVARPESVALGLAFFSSLPKGAVGAVSFALVCAFLAARSCGISSRREFLLRRRRLLSIPVLGFFRPATKARCATFSIFCRVRFTVEARRRVPISRLGFGAHSLVFFPSAAAGGSVLSEQAPSGRFRAVSRHAAPHQGSPPPRPSVVPMEPC
jgi:hypothetical protein